MRWWAVSLAPVNHLVRGTRGALLRRLPPRFAVSQKTATQRHSRCGVKRTGPRLNITPHSAKSPHSLRSYLAAFGGATASRPAGSQNEALCLAPRHGCQAVDRCAQVMHTMRAPLSLAVALCRQSVGGRRTATTNPRPRRASHLGQCARVPPAQALSQRVARCGDERRAPTSLAVALCRQSVGTRRAAGLGQGSTVLAASRVRYAAQKARALDPAPLGAGARYACRAHPGAGRTGETPCTIQPPWNRNSMTTPRP